MKWRRARSTRPGNDELWLQLENVSGWIRHGDAKLATLIAFVGVAGGGLYVTADSSGPWWHLIAVAASGSFLVGSGALAFLGFLPRRRYRRGVSADRVFYRAIAASYEGPRHYAADLLSSAEHLPENLAHQIYANSVVADRKFVFATWSTITLLAALVCLAVAAAYRIYF